MRLPKRGFSKVKLEYQIVNVGALNGFDEGATVDVEALVVAGLVRHVTRPVKLLADGPSRCAACRSRSTPAARPPRAPSSRPAAASPSWPRGRRGPRPAAEGDEETT
jgi:hypothetical protein